MITRVELIMPVKYTFLKVKKKLKLNSGKPRFILMPCFTGDISTHMVHTFIKANLSF